MKTAAAILLLLLGSAITIQKTRIFADPSGKLASEQLKTTVPDSLLRAAPLADPSGTIALKIAKQPGLVQGE